MEDFDVFYGYIRDLAKPQSQLLKSTVASALAYLTGLANSMRLDHFVFAKYLPV